MQPFLILLALISLSLPAFSYQTVVETRTIDRTVFTEVDPSTFQLDVGLFGPTDELDGTVVAVDIEFDIRLSFLYQATNLASFASNFWSFTDFRITPGNTANCDSYGYTGGMGLTGMVLPGDSAQIGIAVTDTIQWSGSSFHGISPVASGPGPTASVSTSRVPPFCAFLAA